jgi:hypothetical protein
VRPDALRVALVNCADRLLACSIRKRNNIFFMVMS